ncbi:hypothetical protein ACO0QE_000165 [Hanseniaspora vineae]
MSVGESRSELIAWVNELLQLEFTKIEQMGTGAAYCQILDSIYGDVAMHRVKFGYPLAEYDKLNNFKILQQTMAKYNINKKFMVEKLINCRMQDNLEFLQWIKKFWSKNFFNYRQDRDYDPQSRRKAVSHSGNSSPAQSRKVSLAGSNGAVDTTASGTSSYSGAQAPRRVSNSNGLVRSGLRNSGVPERRHASANQIYSENVSLREELELKNQELQQKNQELKQENEALQQKHQEFELIKKELFQFQDGFDQVVGERDFYFDRLRSIETLTKTTESLLLDQFAQSRMPNGGISDDAQLNGSSTNYNNSNTLYEFIKKINRVLYDRPVEAESEVTSQVEHGSHHAQSEPDNIDIITPEPDLADQEDQLNNEKNILLEDAF